jgi:hypothetical protein
MEDFYYGIPAMQSGTCPSPLVVRGVIVITVRTFSYPQFLLVMWFLKF